MSHIPPNGPPPYYGYPGAPPPAYVYVPAPFMPPQPPQPENPTYVTNYYYNQQPPVDPGFNPSPYPPQPSHGVQVVDGPGFVAPPAEVLDWVPATAHTAHTFADRAVKAGHEGWDGSPLWVIRSHHTGDLVPGKLAIRHRAAYIPHCGKEVPVHNFDILCAQPGVVRWLPSNNGQVPVGAIPAGNTMTGEPLYVGRARHMNSLTPGKVHPSHGCCYISYGGNEISYKNYEVLCKIVG